VQTKTRYDLQNLFRVDLKVAGQPATAIRERVAEMLALIHMPDFGGR
jgi:hypothetical protein